MLSDSSALFFNSPTQRMALARHRFFEDGELPTGVVSHAVLDSWSRCRWRRLDPRDTPTFSLVTKSRAQLAVQRNHELIYAWQQELPELQRTLAGTTCSAILTDPSGVLIASSETRPGSEIITPVAHRVGVDLSEDAAGTTAPGLVVKTGKPAVVLGAEHYFESIQPMYCVAAPMHDALGRLAGVLDISHEGAPFNFGAVQVLSLFAASIENRLLMSQSNEILVIRLQISPSLLDTSMEGLVGIDQQGTVAWTNGVAAQLLNIARTNALSEVLDVEAAFGVGLNSLLALPPEGAAALKVKAGLNLWMRAVPPISKRLSSGARSISQAPTASPPARAVSVPDSAVTPLPVPRGEVQSLQEADADHILKTVRALNGNIAKAARQLKVSRGLIYRRLQKKSQN